MIGIESLVGSLDVKSLQVYFYAQVQGLYNVSRTIIPFPSVRYNVGGGFNANGTFTAPVSGTYFFSFNGLKADNTGDARVNLNVNGVDQNIAGFADGNTGSFHPMTLDSTRNLKRGDHVELFLVAGTLYYGVYNTFNGFLIEEDLSL